MVMLVTVKFWRVLASAYVYGCRLSGHQGGGMKTEDIYIFV